MRYWLVCLVSQMLLVSCLCVILWGIRRKFCQMDRYLSKLYVDGRTEYFSRFAGHHDVAGRLVNIDDKDSAG